MTAPSGDGAATKTTAEPAYDVAISFLARDATIAGEIEARLSEGLKVFYFPRAQEQLAGTDGLESMRQPFVSGARLTVVLYREPWGQTEWTRLEESAIKDGSLSRGWNTLLFVQLDKSSKLPVWLPHTHVRFVLDDYGIDQLVGAIKARVQELGGTVEKADAVSRAKTIQREAELLADRQRLFRDRGWIESTVHKSVIEATRLAVKLVTETGAGMDPVPRASAEKLFCVLTDQRVATAAGWKQGIFNDVGREAGFFIREFRGAVPIPGERTMYVFQPELIRERTFLPELAPTRDLVWVEKGKREFLSSQDLGHRVAMVFFDLIGQVNRGEIEPPFV